MSTGPRQTMTNLRATVKSLIPNPLKRYVRDTHRDFVFRRAMKAFSRAPDACARPGDSTLVDLVYGWGNQEFSAEDEYLAACIRYALQTDGAILECGSGLSTILIGVIAKRRGKTHWALEHEAEWATRVQAVLRQYGLETVLCKTTLKDYGPFSWYDVSTASMPAFRLVICDGPPGDTKGGRFGLLPVMRERLEPGAIILLDDAGRPQEREIADRWQTELRGACELLGATKPYIKLTVAETAG